MPDDDQTQDSPAVAPAPDDRPPLAEPDQEPEPLATGTPGWEALAPPGKPDGEVDTRP